MSLLTMSPFLLGIFTCIVPSLEAFKILATAPVNPIEEGGILSLHCQVWDLPKDNEVRLLRTLPSGDTLSISVNELVMVTEDDRYFLAKRQLDGGSFVYFMSVMDITQDDGGVYTCKVYNTTKGNMVQIGASSVDFRIEFFPSEPNPICSSSLQGNLEFDAGTEITLKCTSEAAYPAVSLEWSTGPDQVYNAEQEVQDTSVYSELTITLRKRHSNKMFLCTMTSKAFPGRKATCHIGPIQIISNPDDIYTDVPDYVNPKLDINNIISIDTPRRGETDITVVQKPKDCKAFCSSSSTIVFQWIVSTVVAAGLAFIFFIMGVVLLIKYHKTNVNSRPQYDSRSQYACARTERIYSELEGKQQESQNTASYMYLHHSKPLNQDIIVRDTTTGGHYDGNQNVGKN
ncbi:uncharacterized protein [Amphiura filiformis]|uniref:uncharacterized protein n=1 Tax=Amphiura filiformis TaxID=82378 RepID=UPI003B217411